MRKGFVLSPLEKIAKEVHDKYFEEHRQNKTSVEKVNKAMTVIGFLGPASTSIQVFHIFSTKIVSGITPQAWIGYIFVSICWAVYGFFHKDKPVLVVNTISCFMSLSILVGYYLFK